MDRHYAVDRGLIGDPRESGREPVQNNFRIARQPARNGALQDYFKRSPSFTRAMILFTLLKS